MHLKGYKKYCRLHVGLGSRLSTMYILGCHFNRPQPRAQAAAPGRGLESSLQGQRPVLGANGNQSSKGDLNQYSPTSIALSHGVLTVALGYHAVSKFCNAECGMEDSQTAPYMDVFLDKRFRQNYEKASAFDVLMTVVLLVFDV